MPYAEPYVYLRALGTFGTVATIREEWGVGFKFRHPEGSPSLASLVSFLETASVPISNFHAGAIQAGSACYLREITAAYVGTDGKYVGGGAQQTTRRPYTTPVQGTGSTQHPFSQAVVISLRTAVTRGPGSNGRVYWPCTAIPVAGDSGLMSSTTQGFIADEAKVLIDNLNAAKVSAMPGTGLLSVMSKVGTGIAATVTSIRVGGRFDAQESRERKLSEAYVSRPISASAALLQERDSRPIGQPFEV